MKLDHVDRRMRGDAACLVERRIHEHRDARDERRQRGDPRGVVVEGDAAFRAGEQIKPERIGTERDRIGGVGGIRNPANFHPHPSAHSTTRPSTRFGSPPAAL